MNDKTVFHIIGTLNGLGAAYLGRGLTESSLGWDFGIGLGLFSAQFVILVIWFVRSIRSTEEQ